MRFVYYPDISTNIYAMWRSDQSLYLERKKVLTFEHKLDGLVALVADPVLWNSTTMKNTPIFCQPLYIAVNFEPIMGI